MIASDFVHLHNHTHYSLLDGLTKVNKLVKFVKKSGMVAVAMTDHGTLSGAIDMYKECLANDIKPLLGMEAYVAARTIHDREPAKDKQYFHLIIIAMNETGYKNLMQLSTIANLEGVYYKPRIDHDLLEKYNEGLIVLSACIGGEIGDALRQEQYEKAKSIATWYKSIFGDRYYFEFQDHGHPDHPHKWDEQVKVNEKLHVLAKELNIPGVITSDAHYLTHAGQDAHEILLSVQTGSFLSDPKRMLLKSFELHVTEPLEIIERWAEFPDLIKNTRLIADRCHIEFELGKILIPKFPTKNNLPEKEALHIDVWRGLVARYTNIENVKHDELSIEQAQKLLTEEIITRANYELSVIDSMGFNGYFLIISDFINWGKDQGIVFGPGRGSAAGSIIAYALRITEPDPLKYGLLFERFLNPDRISMPDIDIDIQDTRRDEVIEYCVNKYGKSRVANIVTFGTMAARAAVKDVARVLEVPYAEADRLAKMVPPPVQGRHIALEKSLIENQELKAEYESNPESRKIFDLAVQLEGTIRSHGMHAAGVVIAPDDIVKFAPLEISPKGSVSTQYPMGPVEELGLLKMDFLGLSNLTVINNAVRIIKRVYEVDIDINQIPLDDPETFNMLKRGDTTGVFQLESQGMKKYLKELKPTVFEDIIAMCALYRPGPLSAGLVDMFVRRKNKLENVSYDHPLMEPALSSTFGVLVYQEQVMQISKDVCGFSGGEADTLRKAIGKKKLDVMAKMQVKFIEGAVANGVSRPVIEKFWTHLLGFADYCFNKSHSACYGLIAYQTAYLKANYPDAFMAALMTSDYDDTDRLSIEISDTLATGIKVLPPSINESFVEFSVVPGEQQIRFGMSAVKNVGTSAVEEILRARKIVGGKFETIEEYAANVSPRIVNKKSLEALIKPGAFDDLLSRSVGLANIDTILKYSDKLQKETISGQTDIFAALNQDMSRIRPKLALLPAEIEYVVTDNLRWERELLGLYLSEHPLDRYKDFFIENSADVTKISKIHDGKQISVGGTITEIREIITKKGSKMAFAKIACISGEIEAVVFPSMLIQAPELWTADKIVLINAKVQARDRDGNLSDDVKILPDTIREVSLHEVEQYTLKNRPYHIPKPGKKIVDESVTSGPKYTKLYLRILNTNDVELMTKLKQTLDDYSGNSVEVILVLGPDDAKQVLKLPSKIVNDSRILDEIAKLLEPDKIVTI